MATKMLIDATHAEETRVAVVNNELLEEFDFETSTKKQNKGNIYLAKVTRVEPSLQAAFVDYGGDRYYTHEFINNVGAPPTETSITLQFGEIDLVTRERAVNGF